MPRYRVRLPESFTGAFSLSRQLAPSVPHLSGLSPTSHSRVFNCRLFYTMSMGLSIDRADTWSEMGFEGWKSNTLWDAATSFVQTRSRRGKLPSG